MLGYEAAITQIPDPKAAVLNTKRGSQPNTASPNCSEYDRAMPQARSGRDGRQEGRECSYYDLHCYLNDAFLHPLPLV